MYPFIHPSIQSIHPIHPSNPSIHPSIFSPIQSIHPRSISRRSMMRAKQIMNSIMKIVAATTSTKTPLKISARHAPEKTLIKVLIKSNLKVIENPL
jgi:hypothetical protein